MKKIIFLLYINSFIFIKRSAQTEEWYGSYTYEASLGENAAEDQIIIQYSFIFTKDKCLVTSQGYQTDKKIICTTETIGKDLPAVDMVEKLDIQDLQKFDNAEYGNIIRRWWDIKRPGFFGKELGAVMMDISVQKKATNRKKSNA